MDAQKIRNSRFSSLLFHFLIIQTSKNIYKTMIKRKCCPFSTFYKFSNIIIIKKQPQISIFLYCSVLLFFSIWGLEFWNLSLNSQWGFGLSNVFFTVIIRLLQHTSLHIHNHRHRQHQRRCRALRLRHVPSMVWACPNILLLHAPLHTRQSHRPRQAQPRSLPHELHVHCTSRPLP